MAEPVNQQPNVFYNLVLDAAFNSTLGGIAGWAFNIIHPVGGLIFGAIYSVTDFSSNMLLDKTTLCKCGKFVLNFFIKMAAAVCVTTLIGYTFTFMSGVILVIGMSMVSCIIACLAKCCPCLKILQNNDEQPAGV